MNADPPSASESDDNLLRQALDATGGTPPALPGQTTETLTDTPTRMPKRIGRYHIKSVIASGGMGTVYEAVQEKPHRTVALKLMRHGIASRSALRRFEYESQILARLRHPGIAQVYEAGTHRDDSGTVPYFAMEYIVGAKPITKYVAEKRLTTRQKLELFAQVCEAVHHGHQKGIIHRDLKPSNILVDAQEQVKIIDFGVARSTDSDLAVTTLQTDIGQLIGTLQYMSPEQCEADPHNIDTRSDVYALGVVLYELLSGRLPYKVSSKQIFEATRTIREQQPTKLTTIDKSLKGDLETVVFKALEKDRERRYQSATDFAQDIRRYLSNEAIIARPPSIVYQLRVFARRNKALFGAIAAVFVVLVGGVIVSTSLYVRSEANRVKAESEATKAQTTLAFLQERLQSVDPSKARGQDVTVRSMLDETARKIEAGELSGQPEMEADIRTTLGKTYLSLGHYDDAEIQLRKAEAIRTRVLGDEDSDTLRTRMMLGKVLGGPGRSQEAEALLRRTADAQRRVLGEEHPDTLRTLYILAATIRAQYRLEEAEELYRRTLAAQQRVLGEEHLDTLRTMNGMAGVLRSQGRYAESEAILRRNVELKRLALGPEHPDTLASMSNLGYVLNKQGKYAEAETLHRKTLEIRRRVLGDEHPSTLLSIEALASVLYSRGNPEEVRREVVGLLAVLERVAHKPDADASALNACAWHLLICEPEDLRDPQAALLLARKAVEASAHRDHGILDTLALAYQMTGDIDKAVEIQTRAVSLLSSDESRRRAALETRLAAFLREKGDDEPAESVLRKAVDRARMEHGEKHAQLVRTMTDLALLLHARGRYFLNSQVCGELAQVRGGSIPWGELGIANTVVYYATALLKRQKYTEAEPLLRHVLSIRQAAYLQGDWRVAHVMSVLGTALVGQDKLTEAEPLLLEGYNRMKDHAETIPAYLRAVRPREALERIVKLYESWGKPDQAAEYRQAAKNEFPDQGHAPPANKGDQSGPPADRQAGSTGP